MGRRAHWCCHGVQRCEWGSRLFHVAVRERVRRVFDLVCANNGRTASMRSDALSDWQRKQQRGRRCAEDALSPGDHPSGTRRNVRCRDKRADKRTDKGAHSGGPDIRSDDRADARAIVKGAHSGGSDLRTEYSAFSGTQSRSVADAYSGTDARANAGSFCSAKHERANSVAAHERANGVADGAAH